MNEAKRNEESSLTELLAVYWDLAYTEGVEGREYDTPDGAANKALFDIRYHVAESIEQAHMAGQADAGVDPSYNNAQLYRKRLKDS